MTNKYCLLISISLFIVSQTFSQTKYKLPAGFIAYKDVYEKQVQANKDFDNDGVNDLAIIATKTNDEENNYVFMFLSQRSFSKNPYSLFPITASSGYNLAYEKSVLTIGGCFGNGRYCETYKFKYYPKLSDMRLIGYEEENFGNALHEEAYLKSVNLVTNTFELDNIFIAKKSKKMRR